MSSLRLSDAALAHFEVDFVQEYPPVWAALSKELKALSKKNANILDLGGGTGIFSDRIAREFPKWRVTLVDNADYMLAKNKPHPRKKLIKGSAENLASSGLMGQQFDVIFLNFILHHIVTRDFKTSRRLQE